MALTLQSAIDRARIDLNDTDAAAYRNSDEDMLKHANDALLAIHRVAPHLWHGNYSNEPTGEHAAAFAWPIGAQFVKVASDIVVAYAESKDDEHVLNQRVASILDRAFKMLVA